MTSQTRQDIWLPGVVADEGVGKLGWEECSSVLGWLVSTPDFVDNRTEVLLVDCSKLIGEVRWTLLDVLGGVLLLEDTSLVNIELADGDVESSLADVERTVGCSVGSGGFEVQDGRAELAEFVVEVLNLLA